jgi:hypothetical protein
MQPVRYFDVETEGLDNAGRIIFANLNGKCLSLRDHSEIELLATINDWLHEYYQPPIIGKNLIFDLWFLATRGKEVGVHFSMMHFQRKYKHLDMKHVAVVLNGGEFKGYPKWIDQKEKPQGDMIPEWFRAERWDLIEEYSEKERLATLKFYEWIGSLLSPTKLEDRPY